MGEMLKREQRKMSLNHALKQNKDSCVCFESDGNKCKHVLLCVLYLAETGKSMRLRV